MPRNDVVGSGTDKSSEQQSENLLWKAAEIVWTFRFSLSSQEADRTLKESLAILGKVVVVSVGLMVWIANLAQDIGPAHVAAYEGIYVVTLVIYGFAGRALHPTAPPEGFIGAVAYAEMLACWRVISDLITWGLLLFSRFSGNLPQTALVGILMTSILILIILSFFDRKKPGAWWRSNIPLVFVNSFLSVMFLYVLPHGL